MLLLVTRLLAHLLPVATLVVPSPAPGVSCTPHLELETRWRTARVRTAEPECTVTLDELARLLERELAADPPLDAREPLESIFLGRLIGYPELSRRLVEVAAEDRRWRRTPPPGPGEANRWVAETLATSAALAAVRGALEEHGWELAGFSCEKVLRVTRQPSVPDWAAGRIGMPYDALCWMRVARR
jgi:hypothetical protein